MKYIWIGISLLAGLLLTYQSLKEEGKELNYALESPHFLVTWKLDDRYAPECHNEGQSSGETDIPSTEDIQKIIEMGLQACAFERYVTVPSNVAMSAVEILHVPVRATVPYELAKRVLAKEQDKPPRCSDYTEVLIATCPKLLSPHYELVEID